MKRSSLVVALALLFCTFMVTSCGYHPIEAGYVGVKVDKLGSNKGVQNEVLGVGRYFPTINEEIYDFPTFQVNYVYTQSKTEGSEANEEFTFQTKEGMECSADLGVAMHFEVNKIPFMFQTYRKGVDEIRSVVVRNEIRDALNRVSGNMPVESVYGEGKGHLIDSVTSIVQSRLTKNGIVVDKISLIGSIRIPEKIIKALNAKGELDPSCTEVIDKTLKQFTISRDTDANDGQLAPSGFTPIVRNISQR